MIKTVLPTKGNLLQLKRNHKLALLGQDLMEQKKNILINEMLALFADASKLRNEIEDAYRRAYRALQEANITLGIVGDIAKAIPIDNNIDLRSRSVMGVDLPVVKYQSPEVKLSYGLGSTNTKFDYAYVAFQEARDLTLKLAEIDNSAYRLASAIRKSQKRANALKNVVIPTISENITYIINVLEEREREEFIRMKMIKYNHLK
jgi:V/A-type H+-transporting ATPase subunit D